MKSFDVNSEAAIQLTAKLGSLHRSAFPSAVRNTLNDAAFQMKKKEILNSAQKNFNTIRSKSLFTGRRVVVKKANGWDVNVLKSVVGFSDAGDASVRAAVEGLEKQETGGIVNTGSRYLKGSRIKSSNSRKVKRGNYYDRGNVISGRSKRGGTRKSKFVSRMYRSYKEKKPFFMNTMKGNFLVRTVSFRKIKGNKIKTKLRFLMMSRDKTPVKIKPTRFMSKAGISASIKMPKMFKNNAEFQIKKHLK